MHSPFRARRLPVVSNRQRLAYPPRFSAHTSTSGASEVLAGAIKDNKRGDVVGERTFGSASEQKVIPLDDGGAVILTADSGKMTGIFTDGDLRRLITADSGGLELLIRKVMMTNPKRILGDQLATEAMSIMRQFRIDELPVVDADDRPVGLIDVQDLVVLKLFDVEPEM